MYLVWPWHENQSVSAVLRVLEKLSRSGRVKAAPWRLQPDRNIEGQTVTVLKMTVLLRKENIQTCFTDCSLTSGTKKNLNMQCFLY